MAANFKEKYWKYSLIALILITGFIIFREAWSFVSGFLGAFTIYILVRKQMFMLSEKKKLRKSIAAIIILAEVFLIILIPTFLIIWILLGRLQSFDLHPSSLFLSIQNLITTIQDKTGYDIVSSENISKATEIASSALQIIVGQISSFVINSFVLLIVLYFMLISGRQMESYYYELLPFDDKNKRNVLTEIDVMVKANAIGVPLLALIQGLFATIGFIIFDTPTPVLFGILTCIASIFPLIGVGVVWIPLAIFHAVNGNWPMAIGLTLYGIIVIGNVDNLFRFLLQKKLANTYPLITIFGVIIGLALFGFWGIIFGPLLLSMFFLLIKIFKTEYLDNKKYKSEETEDKSD